mmetsp:Transcript_32007/g.52879  ORF Transcript_32007/g.52879 Transcript_32007/m.52879 type:complete len:144 (-) Transcript_32007:287-718(-)|eukprot:CAMPEP_0119007472 /NCGR_PEP_ID=MMETSP1176-20130426/3031_1 /TAXON_ID=265551 /ORGANISM="Synedropsis recta cf, Strain CCMP1620" /LENGTH=143 /DNA_ID=CAMNT_0006959631 /DNA_START=61 /DNA_END=492 /DNA_ORIENTATION=-
MMMKQQAATTMMKRSCCNLSSLLLLITVVALGVPTVSCIFNQPHPEMTRAEIGSPKGIVKKKTKKAATTTAILSKVGSDEVVTVEVGSKAYYSGFVSREVMEEDEERVSGEAILGPTFKFVGGFSVLIGALFLFFMVSNGLLV